MEYVCLLIYVCLVISVIIRDIRLKSYYSLFIRRFVRTRFGAPGFKNSGDDHNFYKNVHLMHNWTLVGCVPLEKFWAVI